jgi:hypothetical protein
MPYSLDQKLDTIARHPFRAKFHLWIEREMSSAP